MRISSVLYLGVHHDVFSGWDLTLDDEKIVTKCVDCFDAFQKELESGQHWLAIVDASANDAIMPAAATNDSLMQRVVHAVRATPERADMPLLLVLASDAAFESLAALADTSCTDYLIAPVCRTAYFARLKLFREIRRSRQDCRDQNMASAVEDQFQTLADNAPVMIWVADTDKQCTWFNRPWLEFTGKTIEHERGYGWTAGVHSEDLQECSVIYASSFNQRKPFAMDYRLRRSDGEYRWVRDNGVPFYGADGQFLGYIGSCVDVTDIKTAETESKAAVSRKNVFLAMLSHELRNPLAPMRNALKVLEFIKLSPADEVVVSQMNEVMNRQVSHMCRLLDDLLDMSRIVSDRFHVDRKNLDLGKLVQRTISDLRFAAEAKRLSIKVDVADQPVWVVGDATRLAQVIGNLFDNAVKFSMEAGCIEVTIKASRDRAWLSVKDGGVGLTPGRESRIFERFSQDNEPLARAHSGLGLGLWLVRTIVTLHHGCVSAHSEGIGKGTTFVVDLPRVEASSQDGRPPVSSDDSLETKRILIVEDNVDSAMTLQMILNKWGYQTTIAHTGTEAIKLAVEFKPFAVVCDIGLPELDGYQVATVLRRVLGHSLSMIAVSGYGQREDRERAIAAGFDDHLVKPANLAQLQQFLETTSAG